MEKDKKKYLYDGAVMQFDRVIDKGWSAETYAKSAQQARNYLSYRYKKEHNLSPRASIKLVGTLKLAS